MGTAHAGVVRASPVGRAGQGAGKALFGEGDRVVEDGADSPDWQASADRSDRESVLKASERAFQRCYTRFDILLLALVKAALGQTSGLDTRAVLRRQWTMFVGARLKGVAVLSKLFGKLLRPPARRPSLPAGVECWRNVPPGQCCVVGAVRTRWAGEMMGT